MTCQEILREILRQPGQHGQVYTQKVLAAYILDCMQEDTPEGFLRAATSVWKDMPHDRLFPELSRFVDCVLRRTGNREMGHILWAAIELEK